MKTLRVLPVFLFIINLSLGISLGAWLNPFQHVGAGLPIATLANDQRTILLVVVDHLERDASLTGLWLLVYASDFRNPAWIPIYPTIPSGNPARADELAASFRLDKNLHPDPPFLDRLSQRNLAWSGYVVLDGDAILETMKYFKISTRPKNTTEWLALVSPSPQGQLSALSNQVSLLESICHAAENRSLDFDLVGLYKNIHKHARANFDLSLAFTEWTKFFQPETSITCQFPPISASQP